MTSGFRVLCSDGVSRHTELFPTRRDALTWQTFRHVCDFGHRLRKEAEWPVSEFRLKPPSASLTRVLHSPPGGAEGSNVGTGVSHSTASVAPEAASPPAAPVPATFGRVR